MTRYRSRRFLAVAAAVLIGCSSAHAQTASHVTFSWITTEPDLGRLDCMLAVTDLNGEDRDDVLAGGRNDYNSGATPEDRLTKVTLHVFAGNGDGRFRHAPELVEDTIEDDELAHSPARSRALALPRNPKPGRSARRRRRIGRTLQSVLALREAGVPHAGRSARGTRAASTRVA